MCFMIHISNVSMFDPGVRTQGRGTRLVFAALATVEEPWRSSRTVEQAMGREDVHRVRPRDRGDLSHVAALQDVHGRENEGVSQGEPRDGARVGTCLCEGAPYPPPQRSVCALRCAMRVLRRDTRGLPRGRSRVRGREQAPSIALEERGHGGRGRVSSGRGSTRLPERVSSALPQLQLRQGARRMPARGSRGGWRHARVGQVKR